jgi:hypothetical protein
MDPKKFYFGIYANPVGFLVLGPMVGAEFTIGYFSAEFNVRFPTMGILMPIIHDIEYGNKITNGIGIGGGLKFFLPGPIGGFYVGPFVEFGNYIADYNDNSGYSDVKTTVVCANIGYRFVTDIGFYFRLGAYLGIANAESEWNPKVGDKRTTNYTSFIGLLDASIGFQF